MGRRLSLRTEDAMWALRCQGFRLEEIARFAGCSTGSVHYALRRARRRRLPPDSPIRRRYRYAPNDGPPAPPQAPRLRPVAFRNRLLNARMP